MTPLDCENFRSDQLERAFKPRESDASGAEAPHDEACEACGRWRQRQRQIVGLLGQLDRYAAPEDLDRAVAEAIAADRRRDQVLQALTAERAPGVLDRLVDEEIEAGASAVVARSLAGLSRLQAPADLEDLVAERIQADRWADERRGADQQPAAAGTRTDAEPRRPQLVVVRERANAGLRAGALVAAAAVLFLSLPGLLDRDAATEQELPEPRVQLTMVASASALSPLARDLGHGLAGGATPEDLR